MSKILLVDTNFSSKPILDELLRLGHVVDIVGNNINKNMLDLCNKYWEINYADIDKLNKIIEEEKFDYIVPGCTDQSYKSCAIVSNGRFPGVDSIDAYENLNNKIKFKILGKKLNLPVPNLQWSDNSIEIFSCSELYSNLKYPLIVKPDDGYSGLGITILYEENKSIFSNAIKKARSVSSKGKYLVEDFVFGQLHSHSAFLRSGVIEYDLVVQENCTSNPVVVDTSRLLTKLSNHILDKIRYYIEIIAKNLELKDGLIHTQFLIESDKIWIIEIMRRCPGDLYSQLIELSGKKGYINKYLSSFIGVKTLNISDEAYIPIMRHTITVPKKQGFDHIKFNRSLSIERWVQLNINGQIIEPSPYNRIGILFASENDDYQLNELYEMTLSRNLYNVVK